MLRVQRPSPDAVAWHAQLEIRLDPKFVAPLSLVATRVEAHHA